MSGIRKSEHSESTPFDNTGSDLVSTEVGPAIRELDSKVTASASPGFSFGRSGSTPAGTWLLRTGSVPSNKTGVPMALIDPMVTLVAVGNEDVSTFDIEVYEHEGNEINLTLLGTVSIVAARTETFAVSWTATSGRQLATKISTGSAKNPAVDLQLSGSVS